MYKGCRCNENVLKNKTKGCSTLSSECIIRCSINVILSNLCKQHGQKFFYQMNKENSTQSKDKTKAMILHINKGCGFFFFVYCPIVYFI